MRTSSSVSSSSREVGERGVGDALERLQRSDACSAVTRATRSLSNSGACSIASAARSAASWSRSRSSSVNAAA